ncbi:hypothetical protein CHLNCDRAFT_139266 [Chlorella variabilis]|uniref:YqgF/RNase H-like domain-containing protein n=1 Tax=Chlorella variabilis TaxID=554065 RepID=E1ZPW8_CHLVA|nr:hypothetical protein CHLNCDRAFT_139266 [Chlorella variabilis]EFN52137.1 hypothetical protein CHLNCDRAFT_139266 [Chlorella variabilis]|eukprot:XP_005844239.1 hypothetical protein CHLNCDRAFT_139266 [Chlorella variabilis]
MDQEREEEGRNDNPAPNPTGSRPAHQVRRALGLDYGRRVVGLAVSTLGLAPRPLEGLPGPLAHEQLQLAAAVLAVAQREACDAIVLGLPVTLAGSLRRRSTDSQQGRRCRNFADNMAAVAAPHAIPVFLADERGSTLAARRLLASSGSRRSTLSKRMDSVAAAVILESFFSDPGAAVLAPPRSMDPSMWSSPSSSESGGNRGSGKQQQQHNIGNASVQNRSSSPGRA